MLATAQPKGMDPLLGLVLGLVGGGRTAAGTLTEGLVEISHFSADHAYLVKESNWDEEEKYGCQFYGVADTAEQARKYAEEHLGKRPERFCVFVTHVAKNPANRGQGGGWRWHKWGPYIGTGTPTMEYLDDEEAFPDGIYVFHIYELP